MNKPKDIYEFLMWANCTNKCKFCFQQHIGNKDTFLTDEQKINSIRSVKKFIASDNFKFGSHVLIVGGEVFDTPTNSKLHGELGTFLDFIVTRMLIGKIDLLYVNTNLMYKDTTLLLDFLDNINKNNLFDRLKFTTSYDISGRFSSNENKKLMLDNLYNLTNNLYKDKIHIVTNMILTKDLCNAVLNDLSLDNLDKTTEIGSIKEFINKYSCLVNTIPYIILDENLAADKNTIIATLKHIDKTIPNYFKSYVDNFALNQDKLLYEYHAGTINDLVFCSSDNSDCGHSINFNRYQISRDTCFVCDMLKAYKDYCDENN